MHLTLNGSIPHYEYDPIELNKWNSFIISQELKNGSFAVTVTINGKTFDDLINRTPQNYENIKIYAGNYWAPASGSLRNFTISSISESANFSKFDFFAILN